MIQTGSSGSYFARVLVDEEDEDLTTQAPVLKLTDGIQKVQGRSNGIQPRATGDHKHHRTRTVAVFKPNDEEPYGNLNPKRVLLRRYLWWAMGRPCLIPSFSYLSEVGASLLDDRLSLGIVPSTRLVALSSEAFSYPRADRERRLFREKMGSYQHFLSGYVNASTFLRAHPWPSRPRSLLEQDLEAENTAHGRARTRKGRAKRRRQAIKRKKERRGCLGPLFSCCFPSRDGVDDGQELGRDRLGDGNGEEEEEEDDNDDDDEEEEEQGFVWTRELMQDFRLELEKLVCFDYLLRNTDRGLDNFMVKITKPAEGGQAGSRLRLAAIDNSLAFPWKHPAGIRSYPWGWLYLPTDLIGGSFSDETRSAFIPRLSDAAWWHTTTEQLRELFQQDPHFDEAKFKGQMDVLRGQGYNLLQSLRNDDEGPLELCARTKQLVKQDYKELKRVQAEALQGAHLRLHPKPVVVLKQTRDMAAPPPIARTSSAEKKKPVQIAPSASRKATATTTSAAIDDLQPRSLPETTSAMPGPQRRPSAIDNVSSPTRRYRSETGEAGDGSGDAGEGDGREEEGEVGGGDEEEERRIGSAYREAGSGLGIDVLAEFDKRSSHSRASRRSRSKSKAPVRPRLKTALTAAPFFKGDESQHQELPAVARRTYGSSGEAAMRSGGLMYDPTTSSTSSSSRPHNYQSIQAVVERANRPGPSATEEDDEAAGAGADGDAESRMNMSIASLPGDSATRDAASSDGAFGAARTRTRGSSVGAWADDSSDTTWDEGAGGPARGARRAPQEKLKLVVVERLEADEGVAWQTYLGLQ